MALVLVIDDSKFQRSNIASMLHKFGHQTIEASNGKIGLEILSKEKPQIIFVDLLMPELDGIGFLTALKEQKINVPVVVLTADIQESQREKCLSLGARAFINKPPKEPLFSKQLNSILNSNGGNSLQ